MSAFHSGLPLIGPAKAACTVIAGGTEAAICLKRLRRQQKVYQIDIGRARIGEI
jgi:hypothetical protein